MAAAAAEIPTRRTSQLHASDGRCVRTYTSNMPTFGCHSCWFPPTAEEFTKNGGKWEDTPCATCKLSVEYYNIPTPGFYDSGSKENENDSGHSIRKVDSGLIAETVRSPDDEAEAIEEEFAHDKETCEAYKKLMQFSDSKEIRLFRDIIERQTFILVGNTVIRLLRMAKESPDVFEVVIKHMLYPNMSYSEIGDSMTPRFTKQKVLYCLKHAVEEFPELSSVFLTDTRFSGGKNAIETLANKHKRQASEEELKGVLYGNDDSLKALALSAVNRILRDPAAIRESVLDFNYYSTDEAELRNARLKMRNKTRYLDGKTSIVKRPETVEGKEASADA